MAICWDVKDKDGIIVGTFFSERAANNFRERAEKLPEPLLDLRADKRFDTADAAAKSTVDEYRKRLGTQSVLVVENSDVVDRPNERVPSWVLEGWIRVDATRIFAQPFDKLVSEKGLVFVAEDGTAIKTKQILVDAHGSVYSI